MSAALGLWLFWVALVGLTAAFGAAPLVAGVVWAADRDESVPVRLGLVVGVFMLVWLPALVVGIGVGLAPWAHALGLEW